MYSILYYARQVRHLAVQKAMKGAGSGKLYNIQAAQIQSLKDTLAEVSQHLSHVDSKVDDLAKEPRASAVPTPAAQPQQPDPSLMPACNLLRHVLRCP